MLPCTCKNRGVVNVRFFNHKVSMAITVKDDFNTNKRNLVKCSEYRFYGQDRKVSSKSSIRSWQLEVKVGIRKVCRFNLKLDGGFF